MSKIKYVEMSEKTALEIAEKFFEVLKTLYKITPLMFSCEDLYGQIYIYHDGSDTKIKKHAQPANEENSELEYSILYNEHVYKIEILQNEDLFGYVSCLPSIDRSTYVFCNIIEYHQDGKKRCEMDFAFDIEKRTFVELFSIEHFNKEGLIRQCQQINYIEQLLFGREII